MLPIAALFAVFGLTVMSGSIDTDDHNDEQPAEDANESDLSQGDLLDEMRNEDQPDFEALEDAATDDGWSESDPDLTQGDNDAAPSAEDRYEDSADFEALENAETDHDWNEGDEPGFGAAQDEDVSSEVVEVNYLDLLQTELGATDPALSSHELINTLLDMVPEGDPDGLEAEFRVILQDMATQEDPDLSDDLFLDVIMDLTEAANPDVSWDEDPYFLLQEEIITRQSDDLDEDLSPLIMLPKA